MSDLYNTPEREAANPASNYNFRYRASLHSTNNYVVSGVPFVTSSLAPVSGSTPLKVDFDGVTKFITVKNVNATTSKVRVGFSENGVKGTNYFILSQNESFSADLKATAIYLMSDNGNTVSVSVIAGMTGIPSSELPTNWSGSLGVG